MRLKISSLIIFVILTIIFASNAYSQGTKISLDLENATLEQVMDEIESQSEFYFILNQKQIDLERVVTVHARNKLIDELLAELFKDTNVNYAVLDKKILLTTELLEDNVKEALSKRGLQGRIVRGNVTDAAGQPMPGVNILEKGTVNGVITTNDGSFMITVAGARSSIIASFVGYASQEIVVGTQPAIDVILVETAIGLHEIVVVGYGTQRREEITSSIASVAESDFNKGAVSQSPLQMVQGKVAGLAISRSSGGDPTAGVQMQLRGVSTVRGDAEPLVIIDGVPGGNMNTLVPEDIGSINILRDGSAAAIYGTRGNAGVIIITTKQGSSGKAEVNYSSYIYTESWFKKPDLLDAAQWRQMKSDFENSESALLRSKAGSIVDFGSDTDWLDQITRNALSLVNNLSISGGDENTKYYGSVNFRDLYGFIKESNKQILNGRISLTQTGLDSKLSLQMGLSNTFTTENPVDYQSYRQALQRNPTQPVYNEDGTFYEDDGFESSNPVGLLLQYDRENKMSQVLANTQVSYRIANTLKATATGALQRSNTITGYFEHIDALASVNGEYNGTAQRTTTSTLDRTFESNLNYTNQFGGLHTLNVLAGYSYQDFMTESFGARNRDFISNIFSFNNLGAGLQLPDGKYTSGDIVSGKESNTLVAFFGRINYNYYNKYMLSASIRNEGSSRFGENNKWGLFPAVSAGWTLSHENFMADVRFIDDLKLRVGWGVTGNQGIGNYISLQRLGTSGVMLYQGQWIPGYAPASNPNPDLRWEKKTETNIGIDATLFNHLLTLTVDLYQRTTRDLLYQYTVPVPPNLYNTTWLNVGVMSNRGIEFSARISPVKTEKFQWDANFNISYNKNKLVSLSNDQYETKYVDLENIGAPGLNNTPAFRLQEGQPIGNFFGYQFAEIAEDGSWRFWNAAHDEMLTAAQVKMEDKAILGNGLPKSYMGFTNTFRYGNFDMTVFFRGAFGFHLLNTQRLFFENPVMVPLNLMVTTLDAEIIADPQYSDYYIEKGDYVKLDNLTIGYKLPFKNNPIVKSLRVYASGQNLLCFTGYRGMDPEITISGLSPGIDYRWRYPSVRTFTMGFNVKF